MSRLSYRKVILVDPALLRLIERVNERWLAAGYREAPFADICAEALVALEPFRTLDVRRVLAGLVEASPSLFRTARHTADEVIPLYGGPRFVVALHVWTDSIGRPHSHAWNGAYQILSGTSIQGDYTFEEARAIDPKLRIGALRARQVRALTPGDTVRVFRGDKTIHALSYVDRPGVSISIRGLETFGTLTYDYWGSGLCVETDLQDEYADIKIKAIEALWNIDGEGCFDAVKRGLLAADPRTGFTVLRRTMGHFRGTSRVNELVECLAEKMGIEVSFLSDALGDIERDGVLRRRREQVRKLDHRFLLSALHLATNREMVHDLLREQYPGSNPATVLRECIAEMAEQTVDGADSLLGMPLDAGVGTILCLLLDDGNLATLLARLEARNEFEDIQANKELLLSSARAIKEFSILRPLFA